MAELVSKEENRAVYTTQIDWSDFDAQVEKVYQKNKRRYAVKGFRKGKATRKVIEMAYGTGVFYDDALNALLPALLSSASEELKLEPIGQPTLDIKKLEKNEPIVIEVTTETMPHPTLGDYHQMEVVRGDRTVQDADVAARIEQERQKNAVMRPVERPVKEGDTVKMDYSGSVDGVAFDGGTAENQSLEIGSGAFIPGFEEQLVGHSAGEEFDISVTFPATYHAEDLAGKEAVFAIKLHEVLEKEIPDLDDEFAQDVSEFDTMEDYRASVRKSLEEQANENALRVEQNRAIEKLVEISGIEAPQALVEEQTEVEIRNLANQLANMGMSLDQYVKYSGLTVENLRHQYEPTARTRVAGDLALGSLVEEQKFEASDEEIEQELQELAQTYGAKDPEDFMRRMKEMNQTDLIADDIRKKKALDYLLEQVTFVDAPEKEETESEKEAEATSEE